MTHVQVILVDFSLKNMKKVHGLDGWQIDTPILEMV
jgi:hypothetical protein